MTLSPPRTNQGLDLELVAEIREEVGSRLSDFQRSVSIDTDPALREQNEQALAVEVIWDLLNTRARERELEGLRQIDGDVEEAVAKRVYDDLFGLGGFEEYFSDPTVENIFVNGADRVFVNRAGALGTVQVPPIAESDLALVQLVNRWASRLGRTERRFDVANPRLDLRLPGGYRLHAIMEVTLRPTITIRCPFNRRLNFDDYINMGTVSPVLADFLGSAVRARTNIIIAGGTGTGKTTLLRTMLDQVPGDERIITIEDTLELALSKYHEEHPNVVEMETRQANVEGVGELTMLDLTRECLRMSPDRVVLGEVRGGEALYMLKAMSQGNDGSMCSIHADSAYGVADRVRGYCAEANNGIPMPVIDGFFRNAVDLIIHVKILPGPERRRVISSILEVQKDSGENVRYNELFSPMPHDVAAPSSPPSEKLRERLIIAGMQVSPW